MERLILVCFMVLLAPTHVIGAAVNAVCEMIEVFTFGMARNV
jgi:hypothetical protein